MRGSPFTFSTFALGLNVLDSPYTLKAGEARDCLNVISTPRGAVKKRYGSTVFASGAAAYFPSLGVTDSFKRAPENPLNNAGKWSALFNPVTKGRIEEEFGSQYWMPGGASGAFWNVAEQTNPAASVELFGIGELGSTFAVLVCVDAAGKKYYELTAELVTFGYEKLPPHEGENEYTLRLQRVSEKTFTGLAETKVLLYEKDRLGITVRSGIVTAWRYNNAASRWESLTSVADSTYTKGYSGILAYEPGPFVGGSVKLNNFSTGLAPEPPAEAEFTSLLPCSTGGGKFLIAASGTKLFSVVGEGSEAGTITEIGSGFTEGARWSLVQAEKGRRVAKGPVYLSNGVDAPQSWTGVAKNTAVTEWTTKPESELFMDITKLKPKYMVYFGGRVWAAGIAGEPGLLRWSGEATEANVTYADPTSWPIKNFVQLDSSDGQEITGLGIAGPYLLVFKEHKVWTVFDLNEGENRRISDTSGAIAPRSIIETPVGTFYLTPDQGIFLTNGAKVQEMSKNVRNLLQGFDPIAGREDRAAKLNELHNAAAEYLNGHYYLSYMAQDGSIKTLDYDTLLKSWWLHDLGGNQWVHWEPTAGNSSLYVAPHKAKSGIVKAFIPGVYQDSGANYVGKKIEVLQHNEETITANLTAYWASCWEPFWQYFMRHRFQQPQIKKRVRTLFLDAKGEVESYAYRNFQTKPQRLLGVLEKNDIATEASYTPSAGTVASGDEYQAIRNYSVGTARVWCFMFANQTAEPFEVDTYAADLYFRKA